MVKNILVLDDGTEIAAGTVGQNAILSLTCTEIRIQNHRPVSRRSLLQ